MSTNQRGVETVSWYVRRGDHTAAIRDAILQLGGRVEEAPSGGLDGHFGSRLRYRVLGAALPGGIGRVPVHVRVRFDAGADGGQVIQVTASDDKGWYLYDTTPLHERAFRTRMADIFTALQEATRE